MKESTKSNYPKNILLPVGMVTLCIVFLVFFYNFSIKKVETPVRMIPNVKMPINAKAKFRIDTTVSLDNQSKQKEKIYLKGDSLLNIDLSSGNVIAEKLLLKSKPVHTPDSYIKTKRITVLLSSDYLSTGNIDLNTNEINLGMDLLVKFKNKIHNKPLQHIKINLKIPLSGTIDKESGVVQLSGEATIPPNYFNAPLPISVQVIAITDPMTEPKVNN